MGIPRAPDLLEMRKGKLFTAMWERHAEVALAQVPGGEIQRRISRGP